MPSMTRRRPAGEIQWTAKSHPSEQIPSPVPTTSRLSTSDAIRMQRLAGNSAVAGALRKTGATRPAGRTEPGNEAVEMVGTNPPQPIGDLTFGPESEPTATAQRTIGDGHDLTNTRFATDTVLEACFDNEQALRVGASGPAVVKIQQALIDIGLTLPKFGADGKLGGETKTRIQEFQRSAGVNDDGVVGPKTMGEFDRRIPGGGVTPPPPPPPTPPATVTSTTVAAAPDGSANTRVRVGPGERVNLTASTPVIWTRSGGSLTLTRGAATRWTAPTTGSITVTATIKGGPATVTTFQVVPPDAIAMTRAVVNPIPAGQAGADMLCDVDFGHADVSFSRVQWLEVPGPPSGVNGYFAVGKGRFMDLNHHPNPRFVTIRPNNHFLHDHCGSGFPLAPPFQRVTPPPFFGGGWFWSIPNRFRIVGSGSSGTFFVTTTQIFAVDTAGTTTVSKQGASITRTSANVVT